MYIYFADVSIFNLMSYLLGLSSKASQPRHLEEVCGQEGFCSAETVWGSGIQRPDLCGEGPGGVPRPSAAAPQRALDADMAWCCPEHHISGESALRALLPLSGWGLSEVSGVPGPTSGLWESNRMSLQAWAWLLCAGGCPVSSQVHTCPKPPASHAFQLKNVWIGHSWLGSSFPFIPSHITPLFPPSLPLADGGPRSLSLKNHSLKFFSFFPCPHHLIMNV